MENIIKITKLEIEMKEIKERVSQVGSDMKELGNEMREGFDRIENKLDCYVTKESYNHDMVEIEKKLGKQSGNWDWIIKLIMGIIITALLGIILSGKL